MSSPSQSPPYSVRRQLTALQRGARKSLGQHFLNSPAIAGKIVDLARIEDEDRVIEIGPGLGALTDLLAQRSKQLTLIELDRDLAAQLCQRFRDQPHVQVIETDVLEVDLAAIGTSPPTIAVGNLPYNIATVILERLLASRSLRRIVAMVQLEVAQRLVAAPDSNHYGMLSVFTQLAAHATLAIKVRAGAFVPPPKVDSAVVVLEPYRTSPVAIGDPARFDQIVRAVFRQRRKQLGNSLRQVCPDADVVLMRAGIDAARRPETLSLSEFASLSNAASGE